MRVIKENDMRSIKLIALAAIATPVIALAQVGPNPAVNGSLDPTVGKGSDTATAPDDVAVGPSGPESTVTDRTTTDTTETSAAAAASDPTVSDNAATGATATTTRSTRPHKSAKSTTAPHDETARKPR
jgi:hypothetical protein